MCGGIAVRWQTVPKTMQDQFNLASSTRRIGTEERVIQFHFRDTVPRLPAYYKNELNLYLWGNRDNLTSRLPRTGWCRLESLDAGKWERLKPEPVVIPAALGLEKGVWFEIAGGLKGILVSDEEETPHVYMLTQQAEPQYAELTKHERMPVFLEGWKPSENNEE